MSDGTVTGTSYMFEDVLTYSCDPGFTLIGSSERECQADGTWSCDQPRCVSASEYLTEKLSNLVFIL